MPLTDEQIEQYTQGAERLNAMSDEVLSFNLQGATREDHIGAAEALLSFYEQSVDMQLSLAFAGGGSYEDEGTLKFYRLAAELHVKIAEAKR